MSMDWLILLLLVPAALVPVVLLHGFAGCDKVFGLESIEPPSAPTQLTAAAAPSATALAAVTLTWQNTESGAGAQIERAMDGGDFVPLPDPNNPSNPLVVTGQTFTDDTAPPGVTLLYQVRANKNNVPSDDASNIVPVNTFKTAFFADNTVGNTDQPNVSGFTIVQILASTLLQASGAVVNVALRGPTTGTLTLDHIFISGVAATGDPFDSDVTPVMVATSFVLDNTTQNIPSVGTFFLDQTRPLLVAFDVNQTSSTLRFSMLSAGGATSFAKRPPAPGGATNEAGVANRTAPYNMANALYLIQKIEVM